MLLVWRQWLHINIPISIHGHPSISTMHDALTMRIAHV